MPWNCPCTSAPFIYTSHWYICQRDPCSNCPWLLRQALQARPAYLGLLETLIRSRYEVDPDTGGVISPSASDNRHSVDSTATAVSRGALLDTTQAVVEEHNELEEPCTPRVMAERMLTNTVGASETTGSTLLGTMIAISTAPGLMDR